MNNELLKDIKDITAKYAKNEQELQKQLLDYLVESKLKSKQMINALPISELAKNELENVKSTPNKSRIFYSFLENIDEKLGGFQYGELVVMASRPGAGVSTLLSTLAINISNEYPVLYYSLKRPLSEITRVLMSTVSETRFDHLNRAFDDTKLALMEEAAEQMKEHQLFVNADYFISFSDFKTRLVKEMEEKNVRIVFIDYLQMLTTSTSKSQRELEISNICRELKKIALTYNAGIILSSQLNRNVEYRERKVPMMFDLRDSGGIEEECDKVILLYRPAYYDIEYDSSGNYVGDVVELHVDKNNSGYIVTILLKMNDNFTAIKNFDEYSVELDIHNDRFYEVNEKDSDF